MVRKSSAKVKPIKVANSDKFLKENQLPPIEETFDKAKQAFLITLDTSIELAKRVDNLLNLRDYAYKFYGKNFDDKIAVEKMSFFKHLQNLSIETYIKVRNAAEEFTLEEFTKEEMKDYFEGIIPDVDDLKTEDDLCNAGVIFLTVKPFGEKMTALHHQMLDEKKQREAIQKEFGD